MELAARLRVRFGRRVLGPMTPPVDRIRGEYLVGLLLKIESGASSARAREPLSAELVVSRSGAGTVSERCLVAKPVLFVPSPNVAEDHQTKNARALETKGAAVVVPDAECQTKDVYKRQPRRS